MIFDAGTLLSVESHPLPAIAAISNDGKHIRFVDDDEEPPHPQCTDGTRNGASKLLHASEPRGVQTAFKCNSGSPTKSSAYKLSQPRDASLAASPGARSICDYSKQPRLSRAPQKGDHVAFKILELSLDYQPTISDYKEAVVRSFEPISQTIQLKLAPQFVRPVLRDEEGTPISKLELFTDELVSEAYSDLLRTTLPELIDVRLVSR